MTESINDLNYLPLRSIRQYIDDMVPLKERRLKRMDKNCRVQIFITKENDPNGRYVLYGVGTSNVEACDMAIRRLQDEETKKTEKEAFAHSNEQILDDDD